MIAKTPSKGSEKADSAPVPACKAPTNAAVIVSRTVAFIERSFGEGAWFVVPGWNPTTRNHEPETSDQSLPRPIEHELLVHPVDTFDGQRFGEALDRLRPLIGRALDLEPRQGLTDGALDLRQALIALHVPDIVANRPHQGFEMPDRAQGRAQERLGTEGIDIGVKDDPANLREAQLEIATIVGRTVEVQERGHLGLKTAHVIREAARFLDNGPQVVHVTVKGIAQHNLIEWRQLQDLVRHHENRLDRLYDILDQVGGVEDRDPLCLRRPRAEEQEQHAQAHEAFHGCGPSLTTQCPAW